MRCSIAREEVAERTENRGNCCLLAVRIVDPDVVAATGVGTWRLVRGGRLCLPRGRRSRRAQREGTCDATSPPDLAHVVPVSEASAGRAHVERLGHDVAEGIDRVHAGGVLHDYRGPEPQRRAPAVGVGRGTCPIHRRTSRRKSGERRIGEGPIIRCRRSCARPERFRSRCGGRIAGRPSVRGERRGRVRFLRNRRLLRASRRSRERREDQARKPKARHGEHLGILA